MSRSFMTLFMVFSSTWLNENLLLIFNFFFIAFILWLMPSFLILELIVLFPDNILVPLDQLKRLDKSAVDPKRLLKFSVTSFCFGKNLSFSSSIRFSCILLFLFEKYGLHAFQIDLELPSTLSFSKYCNLACLFRFATRFRCHLNLTISIGFFDLFELIWRRVLFIICSRRFLLKWGF